LIDEDMRTWLIEVNTNPYLGMPNKYISELMPNMLDDMAKLVVDPTFEPLYTNDERPNDFEILYREEQACTTRGKFAVNKRRPFSNDLCYPIPELKPEDSNNNLYANKYSQNSLNAKQNPNLNVLYGRARAG